MYLRAHITYDSSAVTKQQRQAATNASSPLLQGSLFPQKVPVIERVKKHLWIKNIVSATKKKDLICLIHFYMLSLSENRTGTARNKSNIA